MHSNRFLKHEISSFNITVNNIEKEWERLTLKKNTLPVKTFKNLNNINRDDFQLLETFYENFKIDFLLNVKKNCNKLLVLFSGAKKSSMSPPVFNRWSWHNFMPYNTLFVSDPMFYKYNNLNLGWYYGNREVCLLKIIAEKILFISDFLHIPQNNISLFGSSGGGYASLYISQFFSDINCFVINPQTQISKYTYAKNFREITDISLDDYDVFKRNDIYEFLNRNHYYYIQNLNDEHDYTFHLKPLLDFLNMKYISIGNCSARNFDFLFFNSQGGHNATGNQFLLNILLEFSKYKENSLILENLACLIREREYFINKLLFYEKRFK